MRSKVSGFRFQVLLLAGWVAATAVQACTVPVFRYALERWPPDAHLVSVESNIPLDNVEIEEYHHANLWVEHARAPQTNDVRVLYANSDIAWYDGAWSDDLPMQLADSPLRRRIAHELLTGTTATFVMLDSTDAATNETVHAMLTNSLARLSEEIQLPGELDYEDEADGWMGPSSGQALSDVPTTIRFKVHRLSRESSREEYLLRQVIGLDPAFEDASVPMVIAVFGQGRMIPLWGDELIPDVIEELCWFLCGACSCRVKGLNPGVDILMAANWDDAMYEYPGSVSTILPDGSEFAIGGTGVLAFAAADEAAPEDRADAEQTLETTQPAPAPETDAPEREPSSPLVWLVLAAVAVIALIVWLLKGKA